MGMGSGNVLEMNYMLCQMGMIQLFSGNDVRMLWKGLTSSGNELPIISHCEISEMEFSCFKRNVIGDSARFTLAAINLPEIRIVGAYHPRKG